MDAIVPKPKVLFEAEPFIPYMREEDFDPRLKPVVEPYKKRMGFLPNALKLYAYRPEIAETLVEAQQQHHARPELDARSVSQAQARARSPARSTAAPTARRTAAPCSRSRRKPATKAGA